MRLFTLALLYCVSADLAAAQNIGVNSAVNPDATGTPPGAASRKLILGQEVVHNEHVVTGPAGQTQILFLDESAMTVGPNSDLTIDNFVYDPNTGKGQLAMNATAGVMRFVGGKLSKNPDTVTLKTPAATIGIRGGVFLLNLTKGGKLDLVFLYGKGLTVTGGNITQTITRPGFGVSVAGPGQPPSNPHAAPPNEVSATLAQFNGQSGKTGGSSNPPTDASVVSSGISNDISGNVAASVQQANAQTGTSAAPGINVGAIQTGLQQNTIAIQGGLQSTTPSTPSSPPPAPQSTAIAGLVKVVSAGSKLGFTDQSSTGRVPYTGTLTGGTATGTASGIGAVFDLSGFVAGQTTSVTGTAAPGGSASGTGFLTSDSDFFFANLTSSGSNPDKVFVFGGVPVQASFFAPTTTNQILAFSVQPEAATGSTVPFLLPQFGGNLANAVTSPFYVIRPAGYQFGAFNAGSNPSIVSPRILEASIAVNGQGANQTSELVIGTGAFATSNSGFVYANGPVRGSFFPAGATGPSRIGSALATVADANGNALYGGSTIDGFVLDQNNYSNGDPSPELATYAPFSGAATDYAFTNPVLSSTVASGIGASRTTQTLVGQFAGILFSPATSPYNEYGFATISTDATTNRVAATLTTNVSTPGFSSLTLRFGGLSGAVDGSRGTFVDDNTFAATDSASTPSQANGANLPLESPGQPGTRLGLVSSGALPGALAGITPAGVSFCQCQYLQWGYWTGEIDQVDSNNNLTRFDRANINTFVVGQQTVNMPTTGSGAYTGAAVGTVYNNGASYLAVGQAATSYNFATLSGNFAVNNFDGRNFSGAVRQVTSGFSGPSGANQYNGGLSGTNLSGNVYGYFYGPNAEETGGRFVVGSTAGAPYLASGIFAAKR